MTIVLPIAEPKSAEYIYIDAKNRVHLLLPIVGGETIGLDNTCKTVLEMQTFFHGHGADRPSALAVLRDYADKLKKDIRFLQQWELFPDLLIEKNDRLIQIQGYESILSIVNNIFIRNDEAYPKFPDAIHSLLKKRTNCLSVYLSPHNPDFILRTQSPVFTLNRPIIELGLMYRVAGLSHSLREKLLETFKKPGNSEIDLKTQLINDVTHYYRDKPKPDLDVLRQFITDRIAEKFSEQVDLTKDPRGTAIDMSYFDSILGSPYSECSVKDAAYNIISGALSDEFWAGLKQNNIFSRNNALSSEENAEKIGMAIQFFFASINVFCKAQGLSSENFGPELDKKAEDIANCIAKTILANGSIEDQLFAIINKIRWPRSLNKDEKAKIKANFIVQYNIIKNSPHLDEFIFFTPEAKGDFFNHKNRISILFLDLITNTTLTVMEKSTINQLIATHQLMGNVSALKTQPLRMLPANNSIPTASFESFLDSINNQAVPFALYLCTQIAKKYDLTTQLKFKELDALLNHSKWPQMEEAIRTHQNRDKQAIYIAAINYAKNYLSMMHKKLLSAKGQQFKPEVIEKPENWHTAMASLEDCIKSYKGSFLYRFKGNARKVQIAALEVLLQNLKNKQGNNPAKMQVLIHTLIAFNSLITEIEETKSMIKSSLQKKIEAVREQFLSVFNLSKTAIAINPDDPESELMDYENTHLAGLAKHQCLHHLNSLWLNEAGMKIIKQFPARYYTYDVIDYINNTTHAVWDPLTLKVIQAHTAQFAGTLDLEHLKLQIKLLGDLAASHPILLQLQKKWQTESDMAAIMSLGKECFTKTVVDLLNTIKPAQLDEQLICGIKKADKTKPLDFRKIYFTEVANAPAAKIEEPAVPSIACSPNNGRYKYLLETINSSKKHYNDHTQKWWNILFDLFWGERKHKNRIIQNQLTKAANYLESDNPSIEKAKEAVVAAKSTIEALYGETTTPWYWFKLIYVVPESGLVLNQLLENFSAVEEEELRFRPAI